MRLRYDGLLSYCVPVEKDSGRAQGGQHYDGPECGPEYWDWRDFSLLWDTEVLPAMKTGLLTESLEIVVSPQFPPGRAKLTEKMRRENLPENFHNFAAHVG